MKIQTNRNFEFDEKMVGRVQVIKVIIQNYSAKRHEKQQRQIHFILRIVVIE
ncbi:hypothetical protein U1295_01095 [Enterococcus cecorum]|uniref:hypothetical protein n=1 Tax=Enterococcus cecorum TaxID=44008 RepID=UPI002ACA4D32|nr:hypothetical protein [Enterococcus cecorum]MDZ5574613.1 hypothetical protein [Enterococcus cecorum]MDZ5588290.1 hypothetical protein [Enterococcus cecorum]